MCFFFFFFSSRRRHTRYIGDWSSDVCSSDLARRDQHDELGLLFPRRAALEKIADDRDVGDSGDAGAIQLRDVARSEERRVGKECRSRWSPDDEKKKEKKMRG